MYRYGHVNTDRGWQKNAGAKVAASISLVSFAFSHSPIVFPWVPEWVLLVNKKMAPRFL
jgi:hypothetical protein